MKKLIQANITLLLPTDKRTVPVEIYYDDGDNAVSSVQIKLTYNNILYQGNGTDCLWVDAFADLQKKLPHDIKLACCITCRHGNMCPYGNCENQLFCTKGILINSKNDMINLFDKNDPNVEKGVASTDYCDDFIYQSDDCYTYNDYLYQLNKKKSEY